MFVHSFLIVSIVHSLLVSASPLSRSWPDPRVAQKDLFARVVVPTECAASPILIVTETTTSTLTEAATATFIQCSSSATTITTRTDSFTTLTTSSISSSTSTSIATPSVVTSSTATPTATTLSTSSSTSSITSTTFGTATTTSSPSTASTPTIGLCYGGSAPKSTQTASNGDVYGVCPQNDFFGGDIPNTARSIDSLSNCIEACAGRNDCIAAAFTLGTCYLKSTRNVANINQNVDAVYKISDANPTNSITTTSSATGVCAGGATPTSTLTLSNGHMYGVCSGNDFYGGDISDGISLPDLKSCIEACGKKSKCVAVAFTSGTCWLKKTRNSASFNTNVNAAYKLPSASQPTAAPGKCQQVTTGYLCPSEEIYYRKSGKTMCNISRDEAAVVCADTSVTSTLASRDLLERRADPCSGSTSTTTTTITTTIRTTDTVTVTDTGSGASCSPGIVTMSATTTASDPKATTVLPSTTSPTAITSTTVLSSTDVIASPPSTTLSTNPSSTSVSSATSALSASSLTPLSSTTSSPASSSVVSSTLSTTSSTTSSTNPSVTPSSTSSTSPSTTSIETISTTTSISSSITGTSSTTTETTTGSTTTIPTPTGCGIATGKVFRLMVTSTYSLINNMYITSGNQMNVFGLKTSPSATKYTMNADCTLRDMDNGSTAVVAVLNGGNTHGVLLQTDQGVTLSGGTAYTYVKVKCNVDANNLLTCMGDEAGQWFRGNSPSSAIFLLGLARTITSSQQPLAVNVVPV